jgi:hypothetical protein
VDTKPPEIRDRLNILEAERLILTIELRNELVRPARRLLPEAIRQARGVRPASGTGTKPQPKRGKRPARNGSPALLRLISRLAMRPVKLDH